MKKAMFVGMATALCVLISVPVYAGDHKKCESSLKDCLNSMVTKLKSTGFIGVELDKSKSPKALIVTKVVEGSPAEKAGIQVGDELVAFNGMAYNEKNYKAISEVKVPGASVRCTMKRNGTDRQFKLTLAPMPADLMAEYIGEHMLHHAEKKDAVAQK